MDYNDVKRYLYDKQSKMKHLITSIIAAFSITAHATSSNFEEMAYGRVLSVEPLTQTIYHRVPQQTCNVVIEGERQTEQCRNYTDRVYNQRITGYRVKFEYKDTVQTVVMRRDPGSHVTMKAVTRIYVLE